MCSAGAASTNTVNGGNKENKAMGFLLVFFPEAIHNKIIGNSINNTTTNNKTSSSRFIKGTNPNLLFTKARFTISMCALLVSLTLLFFTLSTLEPSSSSMWDFKPLHVLKKKPNVVSSSSSFALHGMGTLYRRGTTAMDELIICHVVDDIAEDELKLFLRVLHRSGITSRADIVFLFGSSLLSSRFSFLIHEENESFSKLIRYYNELNTTSFRDSVFRFNSTQFWKSGKKDMGEPIWGKKGRGNYSSSNEDESESTRLIYGSVVGFDVNELDPENSLGGFLDYIPLSLRRWACYPMLLGKLRRNFNYVMLLDVKSLLLLSDPLGRVRSRSSESIYLFSSCSNNSKSNSEKTQSHCRVNSAILMGGVRGTRRLANAMLTQVVRATIRQHKNKNPVSESGIFSQLVGNGYIMKNVELTTLTESFQEAGSLSGLSSDSVEGYSIIQRGNGNRDISSTITNLICLCEADSSVYRDC
ncbi:hypothetical protein Golax_015557 [Gossypium laxum]|uniref:DUF7780 domain-containing protein n=1 Tax=Gossypium laxum TaxID=34288 RepID=A0A7J8ZY66_9ROSI|nr:hypothetical protein [Gossypium laxum]